MSKRDLPKWAVKHVQTCRAAFGIGHTGFEFYSQVCEAPGGNAENAGYTSTDARYERGGIAIRADVVQRSDQGYEILTHETLHAATGAQRQAVNQIIALLPKKQRAYAEELWQDGNEATVTRLARALTPVLRSVKHE